MFWNFVIFRQKIYFQILFYVCSRKNVGNREHYNYKEISSVYLVLDNFFNIKIRRKKNIIVLSFLYTFTAKRNQEFSLSSYNNSHTGQKLNMIKINKMLYFLNFYMCFYIPYNQQRDHYQITSFTLTEKKRSDVYKKTTSFLIPHFISSRSKKNSSCFSSRANFDEATEKLVLPSPVPLPAIPPTI